MTLATFPGFKNVKPHLDELGQVHEEHGHHQGGSDDHGGVASAGAQQLLLGMKVARSQTGKLM